ncbi:MAG: ACT domain-containing protein [bacterium]|jgi:hypothetical protein
MSLSFSLLPQSYAIARLSPDATPPDAVINANGFFSISRTNDELSIVCAENLAQGFSQVDRGWSVLKIHGPFAFDQVGILISILNPLAAASVGIFAVSTYDTDYILIKTDNLDRAVASLIAAGHAYLK